VWLRSGLPTYMKSFLRQFLQPTLGGVVRDG